MSLAQSFEVALQDERSQKDNEGFLQEVERVMLHPCPPRPDNVGVSGHGEQRPLDPGFVGEEREPGEERVASVRGGGYSELEQMDCELMNFEMLSRGRPFYRKTSREEEIRLILRP